MVKLFLYLSVPVLLACQGCKKKKTTDEPPITAPVSINDKVLTQNLNFPWEILWGPDNFIWMTERGGKISRVNPANGAVTPVITVTEVVTNNEGGMLGMVLHPDFNTTPHVFVAYDYNNGGNYREKVVRYTYNGTTLTNPLTIIDNINAASIHNGCRLLISPAPDFKLFISTGDASNQSLPQDASKVNGKILRVNLDGTIPADNPTAGSPVWTLGHRNPQGLVMFNGTLFSSEHGPDTDDEINIIEKGRNYGWPDVAGFCDQGSEQNTCTTKNVRQPIKAWTPTIAVSGMDHYASDSIPQWKHSLLVATLKNNALMQLTLNGQHTEIIATTEFFKGKYGRMRDVCVSPGGKVYICTSNGGDDKIIEVSRKP